MVDHDVTAVILHPEPGPAASPLEVVVATARVRLAERHRAGFLAAGASAARVITGPFDDTPFGRRLRSLAAECGDGGLVVLGSGAIPLATTADLRAFVAAAAAHDPGALANDRFSADVVAIARAARSLRDLPDLTSDNVLPRWLAETAGIPVRDVRRRWRLGVDIDGPLDLALLGGAWSRMLAPADRARVDAAVEAVRAVTRDPRAELLVTGRTSSGTLRWLERATASRTRALVEERGLRTAVAGQRPPASVLGVLLERDGPGALGSIVARLGDAAVVDTRVLLAHRLGADERRWPSAADRFASDLLLHERIADPWLRELTAAAAAAPIPILLGGHTLVGPGLRLAIRARQDPGQAAEVATP
jgi:CTP:molybdopterin cytidylyltransferase MocA